MGWLKLLEHTIPSHRAWKQYLRQHHPQVLERKSFSWNDIRQRKFARWRIDERAKWDLGIMICSAPCWGWLSWMAHPTFLGIGRYKSGPGPGQQRLGDGRSRDGAGNWGQEVEPSRSSLARRATHDPARIWAPRPIAWVKARTPHCLRPRRRCSKNLEALVQRDRDEAKGRSRGGARPGLRMYLAGL